jgi:hypothetical protein
MEDKYFPNDTHAFLRVDDPKATHTRCLDSLVSNRPPSLPWPTRLGGLPYKGLFTGPTSVAYYFLIVSRLHPELVIYDKTPSEWCLAYLSCEQAAVPPNTYKNCGISNEYLAYNTINACATLDVSMAQSVLSTLTTLDTEPDKSEWMLGRAGALYLLRILRTYLPSLAEEINHVAELLITHLLAQVPWTLHGTPFIGAVHGSIGIITQIVLTSATHAPKLEAQLVELLDLQGADGNWPKWPGHDSDLVQFCYGAPGIIVSLVALRPHFPGLQARIDDAVESGRKCVWEKGLLAKEPNICHGITGNALALTGPQREHFLAKATPEEIEKGIKDGKFKKGDEPWGLLWGEAGRAWVWMCEADRVDRGVVLYTDV